MLKQNINIKEYLIDIKDNEIYLGVKIVNNYSFNMLRNYILEQLPSYFCPKYIIDINNVIANINGKAIFNIEDEEDKEISVYISSNNIIDSIPIYNFYLLRNKIGDKFNISFNLKVCKKFNLNDIIQILEK